MIGAVGAIESARDLKPSDDRLKELFFFHCLEAGYFLARRGFNALGIAIIDADVDGFVEVVRRFSADARPTQHQAGLYVPEGDSWPDGRANT